MGKALFHAMIKNMTGYQIMALVINILGNSTISRGMDMVEWIIQMVALMKASGRMDRDIL